MIILIAGASHTGKTNLAQKLLEKYKFPYYSQDHIKMGLIRSGQTSLTVFDDKKLVPYLWNITKEIIKTAIENKQNLIVEGCYIPFDWQKDFDEKYLKEIKYICIVLSEKYIKNNFDKIQSFANVIENRLDDKLNINELINENITNLKQCEINNLNYVLIEKDYNAEIEKNLILK